MQRGRLPATQFLQSTEALLATLGPPLFQECHPSKVVVVLGAAVSRPLEMYELRFPQPAFPAANPPCEPLSTGHHPVSLCEVFRANNAARNCWEWPTDRVKSVQ